MFSLIITIISIALVAALAVATIYYGGSAFSQGSTKAAASTVVAQAQQIAAAVTLYFNDNNSYPSALSALVPTYLTAVPASPAAAGGGSWTITTPGGATPANPFDISLANVSNNVCTYATLTSGSQYLCTGSSASTGGTFTYHD